MLDPKKNLSIFQDLYQLTLDRFLHTWKDFGLDDASWAAMEKKIHDIHMHDQEMVISIVSEVLSQKPKKTPDDLTGLMRDLQAVVNHAVLLEGEHVWSRFIVEIERTKQELGRHVPRDLEEFLRLSLSAHASIDIFCRQWMKEKEAYWRGRNVDVHAKGFDIDDDIFLDATLWTVDPRVHSVSHHILDWYLQVAPFNAYRRVPERLAAGAVYVGQILHDQVMDESVFPFSREELSRFGGWKSASGVNAARYGMLYDVVYSVQDLEMLFVDPALLPKDWFERLTEMAPGLGRDEDFDPDAFFALSEDEMFERFGTGAFSEHNMKDVLTAMKRKGLRGMVMPVRGFPDSSEGEEVRAYLRHHTHMRQDISQDEVGEMREWLFDPGRTLEEKKNALVTLAHQGNLEAYEVLQKYCKQPDDTLAGWGQLALQECKAFMEADIMEEDSISVGSPVGSKNGKMRYYFVLLPFDLKRFADTDNIVTTIKQVAELVAFEVEDIEVQDEHILVQALHGLEQVPSQLIEAVLQICNKEQEIVFPSYIVVNTHKPGKDEILEIRTRILNGSI